MDRENIGLIVDSLTALGLQTVPQIRIVDNMVAADQTGEVEGFARRIKGERTVSGILADRLCRNVLVSVQGEVRPDFIRDDDTVIGLCGLQKTATWMWFALSFASISA